MLKTTLVIVILLAILAASIGWAIWGWQEIAIVAMSFHGYTAMILGIIFTMLVGCGLMALMFYSSRHGYDEAANDLSDVDRD